MASIRTTSKLTVFGDSSTLLAAAISRTGPGRESIVRGLRGEVDLVISALVIEETARNLAAKAPSAIPAFELFRDALSARLVNPTKSEVLRVSRVVNLKDAPIVTAALRAGADCLATHDERTLLRFRREIKEALGLDVVTPHEALVKVREKRRQP